MSVFRDKLVPETIRLLVVRDLDLPSVSRLAEHFVFQAPQFAACIACGPLVSLEVETPEAIALALGDLATTIAQLENIVCRVVYLPSAKDPAEALFKELHLTPNSVNIHARWLPLAPGLSIIGYTERSQLEKKEEDDSDDSNSVEEDSGQSFIEASNSAGIVKELLMNLPLREESIASDPLDALRVSSSDWRSDSTHQSILLLDTTYAHTLNQVLFHSSSELTHANVLTCICPSIDNKDKSVAGAMKKIKDLHLLGPLSLKDGNNYMVIEYTSTNISVSCEEEPKVCWGLSSIEFFSL